MRTSSEVRGFEFESFDNSLSPTTTFGVSSVDATNEVGENEDVTLATAALRPGITKASVLIAGSIASAAAAAGIVFFEFAIIFILSGGFAST